MMCDMRRVEVYPMYPDGSVYVTEEASGTHALITWKEYERLKRNDEKWRTVLEKEG